MALGGQSCGNLNPPTAVKAGSQNGDSDAIISEWGKLRMNHAMEF